MVADGVGLGDRESGPGFHIEITTDLVKFPKGTPYKAVIFAIGASLKGMGASGLTLDSEEARLKKVIEYCKQNKIFVMAVHIGGESKRGPAGSDNERMIDAVAPLADYLVVTKDSNKDGRFTKIAQAKKIPLTEIEYALGLVDIVKQVLQ
jgi:sugar/nucleoside kinase (ribokinase family)